MATHTHIRTLGKLSKQLSLEDPQLCVNYVFFFNLRNCFYRKILQLVDRKPAGVYLDRRISHLISLAAYEWLVDNFLLWNLCQCLIIPSVIKTEEWG